MLFYYNILIEKTIAMILIYSILTKFTLNFQGLSTSQNFKPLGARVKIVLFYLNLKPIIFLVSEIKLECETSKYFNFFKLFIIFQYSLVQSLEQFEYDKA